MTRTIIQIVILIILGFQVNAQSKDVPVKESVKLIARAFPDSIMLRWAPTNYKNWDLGNRYGYKIVRYTLLRDSQLLAKPEISQLTQTSLKPLVLDSWKNLVLGNKYAAIAAQALYGKTFEVDAGQNINPQQVRSKAQEQEQRLSFALYAADMSPEVAKASAFLFTDITARKNEKYLYRVMIDLPAQEQVKSDTGYVFTGICDSFKLPKPVELKGDFGDKIVTLSWNYFVQNNIYIAFWVERSDDGGKIFSRINKDPLMQVVSPVTTNAELIYKTDSLPENNKEFVYRVQGITSFGENGPYSDTIKGKGTEAISASPNIIKQEIVKGKVNIYWEFPKEFESKISGFRVLRSNNHKTGFKTIADKLKPNVRQYLDKMPLQTGYYKVVAYKGTISQKLSFPVLVQLTDSVPPAIPRGLKGSVDSLGTVHLRWHRNTDEDIYGYRIFRSVSSKDEFSQLTHKPVADTFYIDTLNKKDLNANVYYKIYAVDQRQNQSAFTPVLKLTKVDDIPPSIPVFKDMKVTENGIELLWVNSSSADVSKHILYRQSQGDTAWTQIKIFEKKQNNPVTGYTDDEVGSIAVVQYKVVAVDKNGNISEPSISVPLRGFKNKLKPGIKRIDKQIDYTNGKVSLNWLKPEGDVKNYLIYRKTSAKDYSLYETIAGNSSLFEDIGLKAGMLYAYRVKAVYMDGSVSGFSEEVIVKY